MVINFNTALNQNSLNGGFLTGTTTDTGQTITGQSVDVSTSNQPSFYKNLVSFNDYLSGGINNPQSSYTILHNNLTALGLSTIDRANETQANAESINKQIGIREAQRSADNLQLQAVNERLSNDESNGASWFPSINLPTFNQIKTPLILAGLALGALIILPRLIKSGFK